MNQDAGGIFAVIMAGGVGKRFWPKSRRKRPKQLLNIAGEKALIRETVDRLEPLLSIDQLLVVSTEDQHEGILTELPKLPAQNLIIEPKGKNTAPCIGLAALMVEQIDPDAVMIVMPADHLIGDLDRFLKLLRVGAKIAVEQDALVTVGVEPTYPSTGYGYIQFSDKVDMVDDVAIFKVKTFAEKPNHATAERFLESGDFLWNSGIFVWTCKRILKEIEEHLPRLYDCLLEIKKVLGTSKQQEVIEKIYCQIRSISIDYGVMENARDVLVLKGKFGWNDLGSWDEVYNISHKDKRSNVVIGNHILKDSRGCYVDAPQKCVALMGLNDLIVVDTEDVILICPRDRAQDVKDLVEIATRKELNQLL